MRLAASMICRNELGRYLQASVQHLLEFVDEIRVLDDGSDDGSYEFFRDGCDSRVQVLQDSTPAFFEHEGRARQELLEWTLAASPTHILAIDADEFVDDGPALRRQLEQDPGAPVWGVCLEEVWRADAGQLGIRYDGAWKPRETFSLYAVPSRITPDFRIPDRALACGREPTLIRRLAQSRRNDTPCCDASLLHFGWTNQAERAGRYARYVEHDGGRFHRNSHLESIMWPDSKVELEQSAWPARLAGVREQLVRRAAL